MPLAVKTWESQPLDHEGIPWWVGMVHILTPGDY